MTRKEKSEARIVRRSLRAHEVRAVPVTVKRAFPRFAVFTWQELHERPPEPAQAKEREQ